MEETPIESQSDNVQRMRIDAHNELHPARGERTFPQRLELITVILFVSSLLLMYMLTVTGGLFFWPDEAWWLVAFAVSTATAVILLLSVVLSVFGKTGLSKVTFIAAIVGIIVSVVIYGVKAMQYISDHMCPLVGRGLPTRP